MFNDYKNGAGYKEFGYKKCCINGVKTSFFNIFYTRNTTPIECLIALYIIEKTIDEQLCKTENFTVGFTPCKKCSKKIIKGEYTKLSELFNFEIRNEYNKYIESLKKLVPWSDEDRDGILDIVEMFDNFKDGDINKYDINDIINQLPERFDSEPHIKERLLKYKV